MAKKPKIYRIVSSELNKILLIRGLSLEQERKMFKTLREKFTSTEEVIDIESYKEFLVKTFMLDFDEFIKSCQENHNEYDLAEHFDSIYESIVNLYPPFSVDFICHDINNETFFQGMSKATVTKIKNEIGLQTREQTGTISNLKDIKVIESHLATNIIGQKGAIQEVVQALKLMATGLTKHSSFLFVGPTGVGKTQLSKLLGEKFGNNFYKVNCAEYASRHEYAKLIGSPPGYIGHSDKSLLAEKSDESNRWVFLFDEIEKAHHKLYDFLLSLLDDGTCTDNMGKVLDFTNSIFIFTSNQGVSEIKRSTVGFGREEKPEVSNDSMKEIITTSIKKHFSPEFLNRIDSIVPFQHLKKAEIREIAKLQLSDIPIEPTNSLLDFVVSGGYSQEYGARNINRFIKSKISTKIADAILSGKVPKDDGELYKSRIVKGEVQIINTEKFKASTS